MTSRVPFSCKNMMRYIYLEQYEEHPQQRTSSSSLVGMMRVPAEVFCAERRGVRCVSWHPTHVSRATRRRGVDGGRSSEAAQQPTHLNVSSSTFLRFIFKTTRVRPSLY